MYFIFFVSPGAHLTAVFSNVKLLPASTTTSQVALLPFGSPTLIVALPILRGYIVISFPVIMSFFIRPVIRQTSSVPSPFVVTFQTRLL